MDKTQFSSIQLLRSAAADYAGAIQSIILLLSCCKYAKAGSEGHYPTYRTILYVLKSVLTINKTIRLTYTKQSENTISLLKEYF